MSERITAKPGEVTRAIIPMRPGETFVVSIDSGGVEFVGGGGGGSGPAAHAGGPGYVGSPPLPRWSDVPPTEPGWYWHRKSPEDEPIVRQVYRHWEATSVMVSDNWEARCPEPVAEIGGQWAGPIRPPEDRSPAPREVADGPVDRPYTHDTWGYMGPPGPG